MPTTFFLAGFLAGFAICYRISFNIGSARTAVNTVAKRKSN